MDSKDKKNKDDQKPELSPSNQPEESPSERKQTSTKSQIGSATTQSVAESLARIRSQLGEMGGQQKSSITLNVLGIDTPITFHDKQEIVIGRRDPATNEHPDVDLSGLPLDAVGISRKHLKLVYASGQWLVEDLGSRNGTWLNNKLLTAYQRYKLHDSDQLRTGGISIIVMTHAHLAESEKSHGTSTARLPDHLKLTTQAIIENQQGLSPTYITDHLMPYLRAVIEMIQHVDRAKKRPQREISIVSIEFSRPTITIRLSCSHEVLQFMVGQPFVMALSEPTSEILEETQALRPMPSTSESSTTSMDQLTGMARQFAEEYFPLITPDQSLYYQRLLVPLLKVCIESDIQVVI
jgi:pSer/pThr/pTyr-binding forkhead associated (FHA) protein